MAAHNTTPSAHANTQAKAFPQYPRFYAREESRSDGFRFSTTHKVDSGTIEKIAQLADNTIEVRLTPNKGKQDWFPLESVILCDAQLKIGEKYTLMDWKGKETQQIEAKLDSVFVENSDSITLVFFRI